MTEPHYTIAPLVWREQTPWYFSATSPIGHIVVEKDPHWSVLVNDRCVVAGKFGTTLEAAQAAADAWYRERLRPALREVEGST